MEFNLIAQGIFNQMVNGMPPAAPQVPVAAGPGNGTAWPYGGLAAAAPAAAIPTAASASAPVAPAPAAASAAASASAAGRPEPFGPRADTATCPASRLFGRYRSQGGANLGGLDSHFSTAGVRVPSRGSWAYQVARDPASMDASGWSIPRSQGSLRSGSRSPAPPNPGPTATEAAEAAAAETLAGGPTE
jgi:hypothetical protein